jgi:hypothetical protein
VDDRMLAAALDSNLDIASFQLKLGNILLNQKFDEFFQLFLIHSYEVGSFTPCASRTANRTREPKRRIREKAGSGRKQNLED